MNKKNFFAYYKNRKCKKEKRINWRIDCMRKTQTLLQKKAKLAQKETLHQQRQIIEKMEAKREKCGLTKSEFAELLGMAPSSYSKMIHDNIILKTSPVLVFNSIFQESTVELSISSEQGTSESVSVENFQDFAILLSSLPNESIDKIEKVIMESTVNTAKKLRAASLIKKLKKTKSGIIIFSNSTPYFGTFTH